MLLKVGNRELELGGPHLEELRDSNDIMHDVAALRQRIADDGYLLLRGFHDREQVRKARLAVLRKMDKMGKLERDTLLEEGFMADGSKTLFSGERTRTCPSCLMC
ncbi:hypothetical protein N6H14_14985 [Paenibacillus sp. CC-CFT747]|nr:hypothetical protein N6H14_14985 [Paenibacillus sp. CC-CFT747]